MFFVKRITMESLKPLVAEVSTARMNPLQMLKNTVVKLNEEPIDEEMLESVLKGKFYLGKLICTVMTDNIVEVKVMINIGLIINLVEVNSVSYLGP